MQFVLIIICFVHMEILAQQVNAPDGPIKGIVESTNNGRIYYAFHTIPFAKPPIGARRFLASEPIDSWNEVYDASTEKGYICYQLYTNSDSESEDCLYLSVYTPQEPSTPGSSLPVVVNIHGGGFNAGSALSTAGVSPKHLIDEGVIVVTMNYRLGVFGFLSTGDDVIPGNAGLTDQILALRWVQKNIGAFGGDPDQITIAGQSAGAKSVGYLILSPVAKGLFSAAIMESGTPLCVGGYQRNHTEIAFKIGSFIDARLNATTADSKELLHILQAADAKAIDNAAMSFVTWSSHQSNYYERDPLTQGYYFTPAIDSNSNSPVLPELQYEALASGNINKVPLFLGTCSEEGLMDSSFKNTAKLQAYDDIPSLLNPQDINISGEAAWNEVGDLIKQEYSNGSFVTNPLGALQYLTDQEYVRGATKYAEMQSEFTDVYYYQFSYTGSMSGGNHGYPGSGNVSHVSEMVYIYGKDPLDNYPEEDQLISKRLVKIWSNFAKYRNPTPAPNELLQNITWPKVKSGAFQYVNIGNYENTDLAIVKGKPRAKRMDFWDSIYDKYGNRPYDTY